MQFYDLLVNEKWEVGAKLKAHLQYIKVSLSMELLQGGATVATSSGPGTQGNITLRRSSA